MARERKIKSLLREANKDPMMNIRSSRALTDPIFKDLLKKAKPIKDGNKIVGFYMKGESKTGDPTMANIFITKSERGKGYGYDLAKNFREKNPGMLWFVNKKNKPSINLAKKIGLTKKKANAKGRPDTFIYQDTSLMKKVAAVYHASPIQGLKELDPGKNISKHTRTKKKFIYGARDKNLVAGFGFTRKNNFVRFGRDDEKSKWTLELWKKHKDLLDKPSSMYKVDSKNFKSAKGGFGKELISEKPVKVLSEKKYKTARDMIEDHDIKLILTDKKPGKTIMEKKASISQENKTRLTGGTIGLANALSTKFLFDELRKGGPKSRIAAKIMLPLNLAAVALGAGSVIAPNKIKVFGGKKMEKKASCGSMHYSKKLKKGKAGMIKRSFLEETYNSAFNDELEKLSSKSGLVRSYIKRSLRKGRKIKSKTQVVR